MILDLAQLRLKGKPFYVERAFTEDELGIKSEIASLGEPVEARMKVSLSGETVHVEGDLSAELTLTCCRCAVAFVSRVEKSFELEYVPDPDVEKEGEELELEYTDLDVGFYRDDQIDLSAVLSEQIVLEIPMKPVCREECKGLCDQCGAELNQGECGCPKSRVDPRLASLADIKKRLSN